MSWRRTGSGSSPVKAKIATFEPATMTGGGSSFGTGQALAAGFAFALAWADACLLEPAAASGATARTIADTIAICREASLQPSGIRLQGNPFSGQLRSL
jgi:hypothetical protein